MPPDHLPTVAIPDLHGSLRRFRLALSHAPPDSNHLILLGDVIDTPSTEPTNTPEWTEWLNNGGDQTLKSYSSRALLHDAKWIRTTAKRWIIRHARLYSHANRPTPTETRYSETRGAEHGIDTLLWHRPSTTHDLSSCVRSPTWPPALRLSGHLRSFLSGSFSAIHELRSV